MDDSNVLADVNRLADREHELRQAESSRPLSAAERSELARVEMHLDQCWDLLRQRRARREFGTDPDRARERPTPTVEGYQQ